MILNVFVFRLTVGPYTCFTSEDVLCVLEKNMYLLLLGGAVTSDLSGSF